MGFTRYWTVKKTLTQDKFDTFIENAKKVVEYHQNNGIKLGDYGGENEPIFEKEILALNGVDDEAHESFVIERNPDCNFCKTNSKPYDTVVYELLYLAKHIFGDDYFEYSGDCNYEDDDYSNIKSFVRNHIIDDLVK